MGIAHNTPEQIVGEYIHRQFSFYNDLDIAGGDTLTGDPYVTVGSDTLSIDDVAINDAAVDVNGVSRPIGTTVTIATSATAAGTFQIDIQCDTSNGDTLKGRGFIKFVV